jgi:Flp pilus assembly protein TadG
VPILLQQFLSRFRRDRRGNVAVMFTIAAIPLISAIGCAVDYSMATRMKAKLQSAADAASIAALSQKSPGFLAASVMTGNGSVAAGVTDATNVFNANMDGITGYQNKNVTIAVTKTGIKLAASVTFSVDVPTTFLKVINFSKLTVSGLSSSAATLPPYLDFYLTLDVSGSMGLPSTPAEQLGPVQKRHRRQLYPGLPFCAAKQRVQGPPCHAPGRSGGQSGGHQFVYPAVQYE